MRLSLRRALGFVASLLFVSAAAARPVHTYQIAEIFSSADGAVQFIEMREAANAGGQSVFTVSGLVASNEDGSETHVFMFTHDLVNGFTAGTRVLIATANFASLPGGVQPDYATLPANFLFPRGSIMFTYTGETQTYEELPSDGITSIHFDGDPSATNNPTNYKTGNQTGTPSGVTGSVNVPAGRCCVGSDCSVTVAVACGGTWTPGETCGTCAAPPVNGRCCRGVTCAITAEASCTAPAGVGVAFASAASTCNGAGVNNTPCCFADFNKSGLVSIDDLFIYINVWLNQSVYASITSNGASAPSIDDLFVYINIWLSPGC